LTERFVIGTRGSKLALIQTEWVAEKLRVAYPGVELEIEIVQTRGDRDTSAPFSKVGSTGIFAKDIEQALVEKRVDIAVHSLKDLQTKIHPDLAIGAITDRESARDVLISRNGHALHDLPENSVIGTSSARRKGLLAVEEKKFAIQECRGNLQTRLSKLENGDYNAIILAEAGLARLDMKDRISQAFDVRHFVPAVGQGALGIEIRRDDDRTAEIVRAVNNSNVEIACIEERSFLSEIGGGCHAPVGGHMFFENGQAVFVAFAGTCDGSWFARREIKVAPSEIRGAGARMAREIRSLPGVEKFLEEVACIG